jgi:crotonobetainyl-CoA:carnitine CoA-transferase CaiB-like acyl-CoA transferase
VTAHLVVIAAFSALRLRDATGEGRLVEVNLLESMLNLQPSIVSQVLIADYVPPRVGCGSDLISPYGLFECADGKYLQVVGLNEKFFANICRALDLEALIADPRFATMADRRTNNGALEELIAERMRECDADEWMQRFIACDVMAAPVKSMRETLQDPQVLHSGLVQQAQHATLGSIKTASLPIKLGGSDKGNPPSSAAPALGEHSESVLRELGYSPATIAALIKKGVLR